jgi:hypothetical protein
MKLAVAWLFVSSSALSATQPVQATSGRHMIWEGTYVCAQGRTALRLSMDRTCDRDGRECSLEGVFDFGPIAANPGVPHGAYRVTGTMTTNAHGQWVFTFVPRSWIDHPANYVMVGFTGTTDDGHLTLHGAIDNSSCGDVALTRH